MVVDSVTWFWVGGGYGRWFWGVGVMVVVSGLVGYSGGGFGRWFWFKVEGGRW